MFVQSHAFGAIGMRAGRDQIASRDGEADLRFWRPVHPSCTDIICGETTARALPMRMFETLQVLLSGSCFVVVDGRGCPTRVYPGQLYVTTSLALHGLRSIDHRPFNVRFMLLPENATSTRLAPRTSASDTEPSDQWIVVDDALYADLWTEFDELKTPLAAMDSSSSVRASLTKIVAGESAVTPSSPSVVGRRSGGLVRVADYLRANVTGNVTLDALAATAGLSKFYLLRAFRNAYGLTPHAYQMQLRLARAWRLVAAGKPISWTAYDCGFADQSHLTRRFASMFGVTPGALARQLTLGAPVNRPAEAVRHEITAPSAA